MDFDDTPEEAAFRAEARAWLEANAKPQGRRRAAHLGDGRLPRRPRVRSLEAKRWQATLADAGWAAIHWPSAYGGRDATALESRASSRSWPRYDVPDTLFRSASP